MKKRITVYAILALVFSMIFASCATQVKNHDRWSYFYTDNPPVSILVMPPINLTTNVDAKDYFYYTLQAAVANNGYYAYPPLLSMEILQAESAYDAELFLENDITAFRKTFGADLLLFTKITNWKKHPVGGVVDVEIEYIFRSTITGETVYSRKVNCACDTSYKSGLANSGSILAIVGVIVDAVGTAIKTAVTDYTIVARGANNFGIDIPKGKYSPYYMKDYDTLSGANPGKLSIQAGYVTDNWAYQKSLLTTLDAKQPAIAGAAASLAPVKAAQSVSAGSDSSQSNAVQADGVSAAVTATQSAGPDGKIQLTIHTSRKYVYVTGSFVEGNNWKSGLKAVEVDKNTYVATITPPPGGNFNWKVVCVSGATRPVVKSFSTYQWNMVSWESGDSHPGWEHEATPVFKY